jgi:AraC-like DNA-binding protein
MNDRQVRRSQTITPFGVGAIIDRLGESFVAEDITRWRGRRVVLRGPRIAAHFGVEELRTAPPVEDKGSSLPYYRFPQWLFCGSCRRMTRWSTKMEQPGKAPRCTSCKRNSQLVPMRFVSVCGNGHLDDVPWVRWAHSDPKRRDQRQCGRDEISFIHVKNVGGGLESVEVRCACGAARSLKDLPAPDALKHIGIKCRGRQPWQFDNESEKCPLVPVVLQRGASSVYFSRTGSALDIPPDSNWLEWGGPASRIRHNANFKLLESNPETPLAEALIDMVVLEEQVSVAQVRMVLDDRVGREHVAQTTGEATDDIQAGEWAALTAPLEKHDPRDNFISHETPFPAVGGHAELQQVADEFHRLIDQVVLVNRLREIRVLLGFQRHTMDRVVTPSLGRRETFLPAIEVFGEGVFLRFNEKALSAWEKGTEVRSRATTVRTRLAGSMHGRWLDSEITPRLILLHTFAHVLMRAMAFEAGYSSSSLRERIYATTGENAQAGVLLYTAAGDSEGTMGGLARLGKADRLVPILASAMSSTQWCSLDPVCGESHAQGVDGLSLAACHACALVSETSCVLGNVVLDRMMLTDPGFGYLSPVVGALLDAQAEGID